MRAEKVRQIIWIMWHRQHGAHNNAADFENMNVHMAVYRGSTAQGGTGSSVSSEKYSSDGRPCSGQVYDGKNFWRSVKK